MTRINHAKEAQKLLDDDEPTGNMELMLMRALVHAVLEVADQLKRLPSS
jgi:hypothetical protein